MERLQGAIRPYAWGSRTAIAALQGRPMPTRDPEAELWLGAHPADPSLLPDGRPLTEAIAADPVRLLGTDTVERFGSRLPFMLKVLAAEEPLSMQAHPDAAQAAGGFAREDADGIPMGSARRSYVDTHHKPELLCAVSEFETLCGFRDPQYSADVLERLGVSGLDSVVALLRQEDPAQGLREAVTYLLTLTPEHRADLVAQTVDAAAQHAEPGLPDAADYTMVTELGKRYPQDSGTIVALLLNHVFLKPGEAIYMPAGNLHAYLRGVGVEVLAASDNVLRGGLTPKHVNVPELLRVLRFEVLADPIRTAEQPEPGIIRWPVPVPDFVLTRVRLDAGAAQQELPVTGPTVLLCWSGQVRVDDGVAPVVLKPGEAAFVGADTASLFITGFGDLYHATVGVEPEAD